jgi:hypothetical protein
MRFVWSDNLERSKKHRRNGANIWVLHYSRWIFQMTSGEVRKIGWLLEDWRTCGLSVLLCVFYCANCTETRYVLLMSSKLALLSPSLTIRLCTVLTPKSKRPFPGRRWSLPLRSKKKKKKRGGGQTLNGAFHHVAQYFILYSELDLHCRSYVCDFFGSRQIHVISLT